MDAPLLYVFSTLKTWNPVEHFMYNETIQSVLHKTLKETIKGNSKID